MANAVSTAPTMVTNITGFFTMARGSSFLNASTMAGATIFQSNKEGGLWVIKFKSLKQLSLQHQEVFDDGSKGQYRQEIQRADKQHRTEEEHHERAARNRKGART